MAAVLAAGPGAALSHRAAADLFGLRPGGGRIEATVPRGRTGPAGVIVHRSHMLEPKDFTIVDGIRVTTIARTLLDLAGVVPEHHLARAVDRAERLEIFDLMAVEDVLLGARGKRGAAALRRVIAQYRPLNVNEGLEERFAALLGSSTLDRPRFNALVQGDTRIHQVDAYWPEHRLVVELDSYAFHRSRADLKRDADKQADLELAGHRVTRLTWDEVVARADRTLRRLHRLLSQTPRAAKPFAAAAR
jgi:very-short-patch-repair endonuclease